ncbi:hypothetical protein ACWDRZ_33320, partial [Streptomyces sp. NPDC003509]
PTRPGGTRMTPSVRILLCDDHAVVRAGLLALARGRAGPVGTRDHRARSPADAFRSPAGGVRRTA